MRVPIRKGDARLGQKPDPYLTTSKYQELQDKLARLKESHPKLAREVKRLAEMGDFSENAGYQLAKGQLRGLNQRIIDLENHLKSVLIIEPDKNENAVQIGSRVKLEREGEQKIFSILGSTESDPSKQVISYLSPLGAALMGRQAGETVRLKLAGKDTVYKIISVELA